MSLSITVSTLLGCYLPLLEGLALFSELDVDEKIGDIIIPNPVPLHAQMMTLPWNAPEGKVIWLAREEQIFEGEGYEPGLLRLLFSQTNALETTHYFVGYLWIKTIAAILARADARFSRSTVILPFLIKLLCDHPIVTQVWEGRANKLLNIILAFCGHLP